MDYMTTCLPKTWRTKMDFNPLPTKGICWVIAQAARPGRRSIT